MVNKLTIREEISFASLVDISAMKLNAIVDNGSRLKDFVDIAFLSSSLLLNDMIDAYHIKYTTRNPTIVLKALAFHQDINKAEPIQLLQQPYKWKPVENRIKEIIKYPNKIFSDKPLFTS